MTDKMSASNVFFYMKKGVSVFFEYDTPKIVHIRSKSIGIVNRLIQLLIIGYIIGWVFIYKKGYQLTDIGVSGTTTKVKGVAYTNIKSPRVGRRLWDTQDIVIPAEENNAFFVTTNVIVTNNQTQPEEGCPESDTVLDAKCLHDNDCPPEHPHLLGHGVNTGVCNTHTNTCMVYAWCPIEIDHPVANYSVLNQTKTFTVLIKNYVYFPLYNKTRSNMDTKNLKGCTYDSDANSLCPVFELGYIVEKALAKRHKGTTYDQMAIEGGVISVKISWDCNFDHDPSECKPVYDFDRLDKGDDSPIARGYNFRYANVYFENGVEKRQLIKSYGILFIISVDATAAAFNVIPTLQNLGSGLALLSIATVVCDIFVLYVHKRKAFFKERKYEDVKGTDAFEILRRSGSDDDDGDMLS